MFYTPGSRGDFLYSVLFGNVLETDWQNHTIQTASTISHRRIHIFGLILTPSYHPTTVEGADDILKYKTIRISVPTVEQQKQVAMLRCIKHKVVNPGMDAEIATCAWWENKYRLFDEFCYKIIEFKDLFDVNILNNLRQEIHQVGFTNTQKERVQYNIDLNLNLLDPSRCSSMDRTGSS